jgi:hypothetical protein
VASDLCVGVRDILQSRVIGRDAIADQPIRDREAFENVDLGRVFRLQERLGGVKTAWTAPHDRNTQGVIDCSNSVHSEPLAG